MTNGERLEQIVEAAVAQGQAPGVVAAVARGDETYVTAAGAMAVDGPPMREDTVFRISSVTKPITAAVILGLIEDGRLSLDEPVDRLLPELAGRRVLCRPDGPLDDTVEAERPVTVRDLLTFTWGFGMQGAMFSFLGDRGWGYGVSVLADGSYTWAGGLGTTWVNVPDQDLTVVVLTQRAADETGMPAVCDEVLAAARAAA